MPVFMVLHIGEKDDAHRCRCDGCEAKEARKRAKQPKRVWKRIFM